MRKTYSEKSVLPTSSLCYISTCLHSSVGAVDVLAQLHLQSQLSVNSDVLKSHPDAQ